MKASPERQTLVEEHNLDIGKFTFYQNILVTEFKEGIHVTFENAAFPIQLAQMAFGTENPIVYISHRTNSYSCDPVRYREVVDLFPNFTAFAVVTKNRRRRMLAKLERFFIKKPIGIFNNMEDAIEWAHEQIEKQYALV